MPRLVDELDPRIAAAFGEVFLRAYLDGPFSSLPKGEIDLVVFETLEDLGAFRDPATGRQLGEYDLALKLRTTPQKIRSFRLRAGFRRGQVDPARTLERLAGEILAMGYDGPSERFAIAFDDPFLEAFVNAELGRAGVVVRRDAASNLLEIARRDVGRALDQVLPGPAKERFLARAEKAGLPRTGFAQAVDAAVAAGVAALGEVAAETLAGRLVELLGRGLGIAGGELRGLLLG